VWLDELKAAMTSPNHEESYGPRPEFLIILGLIPPVTVDDVKQAYLEKVKTVHPDHGGDSQQFIRVHDAFKRATEYAQFKAGRMQWLSRWVEQYAEQQDLVGQLRAQGGVVEVESTDWAEQSIGNDFATVLERVIGIQLSGPEVDDALLIHLGAQRRSMASLRKLALFGTRVTSVGLRELLNFDNLRQLDLTGTRVPTKTIESLLRDLDRLESIVLADTGITWWQRMKLRMARFGPAILP
jgi:hypothetical protein